MKKIFTCLIITALTLQASISIAADDSAQIAAANPCVSTDADLSDSAYWALAAVQLHADGKYEEAVATVNACFGQWGPKGGHQQKGMHDAEVECPPVGKVDEQTSEQINSNGLLNDVSLALWAKALSLHELDEMETAKQAYAQCIYMTCGRAWDPNGWFWSPAQACAERGQKLLK